MRTVMVTGPGEVAVVDVATPHAGPRDIVVKVRVNGICGSDSFYIARGGVPPREGATPLGHVPAGEVIEVGEQRVGTDIFLDAAGVPAVIDTVMRAAKYHVTLGIVAVHKKPVSVDFGQILASELTLVMSMGYPTEIFEVTQDIIANRDKYAVIISDRFLSATSWKL
jgi:threonine dehydrogenase-like Zn-dependent dehydrogenase